MSRLRIPVATYRLQFNRHFRFEDARALVSYLARLGVSDLYASPILKARRGSAHGYDITDPLCFNPEVGTEADFDALVRKLKDHEMGLLLDIVPNHMAASLDNPWWLDLLENGLCSPYASLFDIDWASAGNRVVLPIMGSPYEDALRAGELRVKLEEGGLSVCYHELSLPLDIKSYGLVIFHCLGCGEGGSWEQPGFRRLWHLIDGIERIPAVTSIDRKTASKHYQERKAVKQEFISIVSNSPEVKAFLMEKIAVLNVKEEPRFIGVMQSLLEQQAYGLASWKTGREDINYRRFFDINDLVGIRVEDPEVFEKTHALILQLVREGKVTGLRVDHIDGLKDPLQYITGVQHATVPETEIVSKSRSFYVVVEKILNGDEALPTEWPIFGTTGYDFADMVNALFVDSQGVAALAKNYSQLTGLALSFSDIVYQKRKLVMQELFPGEVDTLRKHLVRLTRQGLPSSKLPPADLVEALIEVTACLPVYRTYIRTMEVYPRDRLYLESALAGALRRNPDIETTTLEFLKRILALDFPKDLASDQKEAWLQFVLRWQQLTGAIMAKGVEDTALYNYHRLVSLNEVGGNPDSTGLSIAEFHHRNLVRLERYRHTLNATSTHDTKRSEDVRARINTLSEIAEDWHSHLTQWAYWNGSKKRRVNGLPIPESNMEILLYQTLIGAWPLHEAEVPQFKERLKAYIVKAAREAKVFTSWLSPDPEYESALVMFLESILEGSETNEFLNDFLLFEKQIAYYGALNSLAQVLLKITSPGVPDFYQGTELWDFSLVDPDNRRPVDFRKREEMLNSLIQQKDQGRQSLLQQILYSWQDGQVKLYVTYKALNARKSCPDVFKDGGYTSLEVVGQRREHVCAFGRHKGGKWVMVVVPRLLTKLVKVGGIPAGRGVWRDDGLLLPDGIPEQWRNVITEERLNGSAQGQKLPLSDILSTFPLALLVSI
jgi:(1->4)-alpha-D-glucan 1-alpha-D-glucosylmutase